MSQLLFRMERWQAKRARESAQVGLSPPVQLTQGAGRAVPRQAAAGSTSLPQALAIGPIVRGSAAHQPLPTATPLLQGSTSQSSLGSTSSSASLPVRGSMRPPQGSILALAGLDIAPNGATEHFSDSESSEEGRAEEDHDLIRVVELR